MPGRGPGTWDFDLGFDPQSSGGAVTAMDNSEAPPEDRELSDQELDVVSGGTKHKPDGTAAGNVAAKWSLTQGAAA